MSYSKDKDYGRSGRYRDDDYGRSGRTRDDDNRRSGRARDDGYRRYESSRDDDKGRYGRSQDEERYSSNVRREYGTYSHSHGRGDSRDRGNSKDQPDLFIHRENLFHGYIEKRVRLEVQARHKKTHVYIGTFMAFDLETNVVLADCYRLHNYKDREPLREDVKGLLVVRGSRVQNVRRERCEPTLKSWPPVAGSGKAKKKMERRRQLAESRAAAPTASLSPKPAATRPLKLRRSWKPECVGPAKKAGSESVAMADKISRLKIKEEPAGADVELAAKRVESDDAAIVKRETRGGDSSEADVGMAVKREPRHDAESDPEDAPVARRGGSNESEDDSGEEAAKRFVKQEITLEEFLNTSGQLVASDGEISD